MKDGPTFMWNQHRTVEFQNSDRDAHNPFLDTWEPVCPKAKRTNTPQRVFEAFSLRSIFKELSYRQG